MAGARRQDGGRASRRAASAVPVPVAARAADVLVRYLGVRPVRVRGARSGRVYHASSAAAALAVDARDAAALIRTGLFQRAASAA